MFTSYVLGQGFCLTRQFRLKRQALQQCEDWAANYNDIRVHAFGYARIGYLAFETEPGQFGENICGFVCIGCERSAGQ